MSKIFILNHYFTLTAIPTPTPLHPTFMLKVGWDGGAYL